MPETMTTAMSATSSGVVWHPAGLLGRLVMPGHLTHNLFLKTFNFLHIASARPYPRQTILFIASFAVGWLAMKLPESIEARCLKARQV